MPPLREGGQTNSDFNPESGDLQRPRNTQSNEEGQAGWAGPASSVVSNTCMLLSA